MKLREKTQEQIINNPITTPPQKRIDRKLQKDLLKQFSSSDFSDLSWKLDKMNRDKNPCLIKTVYFSDFTNYPQVLLELKEWIVYQLSSGLSETGISRSLIPFRQLIRLGFIKHDSLFLINKNDLMEYYFFLEPSRTDISNDSSNRCWNNLKRFYKDMGAREIWNWMDKFYLPEINTGAFHKEKLIPQEVIEELDRIFYYEEIPTSYKLVYWLLRLIPNRIGEVISIPFDCIINVDDFSYILKLPTFKQAGSNAKAQWRYIHLENIGLGGYLKNLIQKQQQHLIDNSVKTDFLIKDYKWRYKNDSFTPHNFIIIPFSSKRFNKFLKRIIEIYDVRDKNGNLAHVTSHMFRHNAVTERTDSGLFSFYEISLMSGHHTTTMLEIAYNHSDFNKSKETVLSFEEEIPDFKGKVLPGATKEDFKKLASRPYAREIEGLGICRDVRGCKAQYYKCYGCEYFKIESKDPAKLKEERTGWESKKLLAQRAGDRKFEEECDSNINGINILLERIKNER